MVVQRAGVDRKQNQPIRAMGSIARKARRPNVSLALPTSGCRMRLHADTGLMIVAVTTALSPRSPPTRFSFVCRLAACVMPLAAALQAWLIVAHKMTRRSIAVNSLSSLLGSTADDEGGPAAVPRGLSLVGVDGANDGGPAAVARALIAGKDTRRRYMRARQGSAGSLL